MHKKNLLLVLVLVLAMSFSGCLSFIFGGKPTTLEVTPNEVEIALDEETTVEITAVVKNDKGKTMKVKETNITWVIEDVEEVEEAAEEVIEPVATLSKQTGAKVTVEGKRVGEATITVAYDDLSVTVPVVVIATKPADKTALEEAITTAQGLLETVVGTEPGQVSQEAKDALQTAVTTAVAVKDNEEAKQEDVDAAVTALNTAIDTFNAAIVPEPVILFENFEGLTDVDDFWTAAYKSLPGDETKPLYFKTGGAFSLKDGGLKMGEDKGGRFTIGSTKLEKDTTKAEDTEASGSFDLSKPFKITIVLVDSTPGSKDGAEAGNFQVYLDNNATKKGLSMHGDSSQLISKSLKTDEEIENIIANDGVVEIGPINFGTETSFIQVRTDSGGTVVIKSIKIEYVE